MAEATEDVKKDEPKKSTLVMNSDGLMDIEGFADARVGSDYELYRPSNGRTDRISVLPSLTLLTKDNVAALKVKLEQKLGMVIKKTEEVDKKQIEVKYFCGHLFKGAFVHYTQTQGSYRCLGKGKICCQLASKEPRLTIPVPILKYMTDKEGDAKLASDLSNLEFEPMIWTMDENVFAKMRAVEKEFPLILHDIKIKGKLQGKYVRIENASPCVDSWWRKLPQDRVDGLIELASGMYASKTSRFLGKKLSEEEIRELYGKGPTNPKAGDASSGVQVDDLVAGL